MAYNAKDIEKKWQDIWDKEQSFEPKDDFSLPKKYILSMFPYHETLYPKSSLSSIHRTFFITKHQNMEKI